MLKTPKHLRPCREKVFGKAGGIPLDRNAKVRIIAYAKGYNARMKQPGQHRGPITRAFMEVLEALLWGFHNSKDGRCFPSYEAIAARAECNRDTVYEAIKALEFANILTWVNRITRIRHQIPDLFGKWSTVWRIVRTSNAYVFRDPLPCAENRPREPRASKSENPTGTQIQDNSSSIQPAADPLTDMDSSLLRILHRLGSAIALKNGLAVS
jgi:Helix-turn-helix domain